MVLDERAGKPTDDDGDDAPLVAEVAAGSRIALGRLYRRHQDVVYRLAYRITGTGQDAEDVLQDVFVGLERALARYEEQGRFRSWLLKITARTAQLRIRRRSVTAMGGIDGIDAVEGQRRTRGPADDAVDRIAVRDALALMPEPHRVVFLLKEVEGYRHEEIAELLGISVASSRVRLHRAWRLLEEQVGGS